VQHVVHDVITKALARYRAIAAGAVVLNVRTGEVVAMASVPDFDPNNPFDAHDKDKFNRMSAGIYEMGSTIKSFTTAMVLNAGKASLATTFDATRPITIGKQTIHDFHAKGRILTLTEAFLYSSNISSAKAAELVGIEGHREFLRKIGLLNRLETELPEVARPTEPRVWKRIHSITISFGHGIATTPLQTAAAAAALVNGGKLIPPTFLPRTPEKANALARPVITTQTSQDIRYLYKLNAERGSGGSANRTEVAGYRVGGKTGTAEKVVNGRYSKSVRFNTFIAAFPIDDPQYVVLTIIDEPKPTEGHVEAGAGLNAAPMVAEIITRSAISLGVQPLFAQSQ
jgi:cell division protein FtsI (penicillin-binding protein 3)